MRRHRAGERRKWRQRVDGARASAPYAFDRPSYTLKARHGQAQTSDSESSQLATCRVPMSQLRNQRGSRQQTRSGHSCLVVGLERDQCSMRNMGVVPPPSPCKDEDRLLDAVSEVKISVKLTYLNFRRSM